MFRRWASVQTLYVKSLVLTMDNFNSSSLIFQLGWVTANLHPEFWEARNWNSPMEGLWVHSVWSHAALYPVFLLKIGKKGCFLRPPSLVEEQTEQHRSFLQVCQNCQSSKWLLWRWSFVKSDSPVIWSQALQLQKTVVGRVHESQVKRFYSGKV